MSISANATETLSAELGPREDILDGTMRGELQAGTYASTILSGPSLRNCRFCSRRARDGDQSKDHTARGLAVSNDQFAGAHATTE